MIYLYQNTHQNKQMTLWQKLWQHFIYILSFFVHDSFDYWFISISNDYNQQSQELNLNQNVIFSDDRQTDLHHSNHLLCSISAFLTLIKENITDSEHTKEDFYSTHPLLCDSGFCPFSMSNLDEIWNPMTVLKSACQEDSETPPTSSI